MEDLISRMKRIIKTSVVGIVVNILLGIMKIIVGMITGSIAVTSDAVNNFTDSASSLANIFTMLLASKGATKKHPFGFGRIEYFTGGIISVIVLFTGIEFLTASFDRILTPTNTTFNLVSIILLIVAIFAKLLLGRYTKKMGENENAPGLIASGQDALSDAIITGVTLIGGLVNYIWNINIDGYLGIIVSVLLLKVGLQMLWGIMSPLMGERNDVNMVQKILKEIKDTQSVLGAYDLVLHNYGPNIFLGSVNIELEDKMTIKEAYTLLKPLKDRIMVQYGMVLCIGFYSVNTTDERIKSMEYNIKQIALSVPMVLQVHGFNVNEEKKSIEFDIVVDFECKDIQALKKEVMEIVHKSFEHYTIHVSPEKDFSFS